MISELFGSLFYLRKDTFDAVVSAVCLGAVIETESVERVLEGPRVIDKEGGVGHVVALLELAEELERGPLPSGYKQPVMEEFVSLWIDGSEQPILLIVESDPSFADCNVIRAPATGGLEVGFLHPVVDSRSSPVVTNVSNTKTVTENDSSATCSLMLSFVSGCGVSSVSTKSKPTQLQPR